ncbi:MAG: hypothetical protein JNM18_02840 [Planctomycetaceae bacterium]|nr:hypothetical protein [Planctomycetaceae bacterium]
MQSSIADATKTLKEFFTARFLNDERYWRYGDASDKAYAAGQDLPQRLEMENEILRHAELIRSQYISRNAPMVEEIGLRASDPAQYDPNTEQVVRTEVITPDTLDIYTDAIATWGPSKRRYRMVFEDGSWKIHALWVYFADVQAYEQRDI